MQQKLATTLVLCFVIILSLTAQNDARFFKQITSLKGAEPEWVQMMYANNPNVWAVQTAYQNYYKTHPFEKNIHTQNYKHWIRHTQEFINEEGHLILPTVAEYQARMHRLKEKRNLSQAANRSGIWTNIGPNKTYKSDGSLNLRPTQTNVYCLAVAPSNTDIMYCATEGGGVFKSIDHGVNWFLNSLNENFTSAQDIKVHPSNPNVVYVGTGNNVYKTEDGGATWALNYDIGSRIEQFYIHRTEPNKIFAATAGGLFYSDNDGTTWSNVLNRRCWDIEASFADDDVLYLSVHNATEKRAEILKSVDGGTNWDLKDTGWYVPADLANADDYGCKIGVTPADTDRVYAGLIGNSKAGDNGWIGVYYSLDGGENWVNADGIDGGPYASGSDMNTNWYVAGYSSGYNQGWYNFDLDVSHSNPDRIWIGTIWDCESNNRGENIEYIRGTRSLEMHADVQDIDVVGGDVWITSDGGINYSNDEFQTTEIRNSGISASNFWGFSQGWNEDTWTGGRYHNGEAVYHENFGVGNTMFMGGAESATGHINQFENRKSYYNDISSKILPDALNQSATSFSSLALYPNSDYGQLNSSEIEHDPRYGDHFYMGRDNIFYKSLNAGNAFDALYTFSAGSRVLEFEIARNNPDLIYCLVRENGNGNIYKSTDGGQSFNLTMAIPSNNRSRLDLSLNQNNPEQLWVMSRYGGNGNKVYVTLDGGDTWQNKTTATLNGYEFLDIDYQTGSNDVVYLLSFTAIFYWDAGLNDWVMYSDGLPFVLTEAREIELFYRDSKVRMSSARGIWEAPFAQPSTQPVAQPMTKNDIVYCSRDEIQLECFSFLDHEGATWQWSITPAPASISDPTARNPVVTLDQSGSYDVTLTVTNQAGQSSTKTVTDMLILDNQCSPDAFPGLALDCTNSGDYASIPDLNTNTNNFTISAWVKPNAIQGEYTGIVMNDGTAAGLNFRPDNYLAYHWPGGAWWWDSGLVVPVDEWSHVALVVTPSSITVYLNGVGSTHNTSAQTVDINTMKIGSYQGWGGRNMNGQIDEVAIWNRSLSQEEIREVRHLTHTVDAPTSTDLLAYYQFNLAGSNSVIDKISTNAATLNGGAAKVASSVPVGGGTSAKLTVNGAGNYVFPNTGVELTFADGALPNGEIVVSRLELQPNLLPNMNPVIGDNYWVINNYGTNTFEPLSVIQFTPFSGTISNDVLNTPDIAALYKRTDNAYLDEWTSLCGAAAATAIDLTYDNTCNIGSFSQFVILEADAPLALDDIAEGLVFKAKVEHFNKVKLSWTTEQAAAIDYFQLERSQDGRNWEEVTKVSVTENNSPPTSFQKIDYHPYSGRSYYRLQQVTKNGAAQYAPIQEVTIALNAVVNIYPNPAQDEIFVVHEQADNLPLRLQLFNADGKLKKDVFVQESRQVVDVADLASGVYFYMILGERFIRNGKLVVE